MFSGTLCTPQRVACGFLSSTVEPPPATIAFLAGLTPCSSPSNMPKSGVEPPPLLQSDVRDVHLADAGALADVLTRAAFHRVDASSSPAGFATGVPPRLASAVCHDSQLPRPIPMRRDAVRPFHAVDSTRGYSIRVRAHHLHSRAVLLMTSCATSLIIDALERLTVVLTH